MAALFIFGNGLSRRLVEETAWMVDFVRMFGVGKYVGSGFKRLRSPHL